MTSLIYSESIHARTTKWYEHIWTVYFVLVWQNSSFMCALKRTFAILTNSYSTILSFSLDAVKRQHAVFTVTMQFALAGFQQSHDWNRILTVSNDDKSAWFSCYFFWTGNDFLSIFAASLSFYGKPKHEIAI